MKELVGQVEKTESRYKKECADYAHKIGRLQETIVQRKTQLAQSVAKLRLVEAELSISNQKIDEYQQLVERIQAESKDHANRLEEEMRLERADRSEYEQKLVRELAQSRAEMTAFDIKVTLFHVFYNAQISFLLWNIFEKSGHVVTFCVKKLVQLLRFVLRYRIWGERMTHWNFSCGNLKSCKQSFKLKSKLKRCSLMVRKHMLVRFIDHY